MCIYSYILLGYVFDRWILTAIHEIYVPGHNLDATKTLLNRYGIAVPEKPVVMTAMCTRPEVAGSMNVPWQKIYGVFFNNWVIY